MASFVKMLQNIAAMPSWWTLLKCRFKTWATICIFSILFVSFALLYRALTSIIHMDHRIRHSDPIVQTKLPQMLTPKHKDLVMQKNLQLFRKDLLFANLIPWKFNSASSRELMSAEYKEVLTTFFKKLYPSDYASAAETDEVALDLKYLLIDTGFESQRSCKQIDNLIVIGPAYQMQSKFVEFAYEATNQSQDNSSYMNIGVVKVPQPNIIVKSSQRSWNPKRTCFTQALDVDMCEAEMNYRLLREVLLLTTLRHPNIIIMKGYCLRGKTISEVLREKGIILVTELGVTFTEHLIAASTWSQRVSMALQVAKLLLYLDNTTFGSLRFKELALKDFVLVRGTLIKLVDLDGLEVGNMPCSVSFPCKLQNMTEVNYCKKGYCENLNPIINLYIAQLVILKPLLRDPPGRLEEALVSRMTSLDISTVKLVKELQILFNKYPPNGPVNYVDPDQTLQPGNSNKSGMVERNNTNALSNFIRHGHRNFAGTYDYPCAGSRVTWGCVFTVNSLMHAARLCLKDPVCQCFVVFSSDPENESSMTITLKNAIDSNPLIFAGTTLFVRLHEENTSRIDEKREGISTKMFSSGNETGLQDQEFGRHIREKRIMAHLGFEGVREEFWKNSTLTQIIKDQDQVMKADGVGGHLVANFAYKLPDSNDISIKQIVFICEEGPEVHHKAYAVVYQLDRILGLYHTPPCVSRRLTVETMEQCYKVPVCADTFKHLVRGDGTLSGVMVVPPSSVMKDILLTLTPLQDITAPVLLFGESQKYELEYILLLWLSGVERSSHSLGYKDHLINFKADRAFTSLNVNMSAYLYHCQFPAFLYQSLECFRCHTQDKIIGTPSQVCSFGEEVIKRTRAMFPNEIDLVIHGLKEADLAIAMNTAASSILNITDTCIKIFGRDNVLY